jgi:nitroreductase
MDTYDAIVAKRDRRSFMDRPIPEDAMRRILQAARMTGSSKNAEPNRFVLVRDRERLQKLASIPGMARWMASAAAAVVIVQTQKHEFDAGRCAQNMMLAAWNEGIGSCPAHINEAALAELLHIPADLHINRVIGFGYIDPEKAGPPPAVARKRRPLDELVHEESWDSQ